MCLSKTCFKCGDHLPLDAFYKHSRMADGHLNKCKQCTKKDTIENRQANLYYYQAYDRSRGSLPHRLQAAKDYQKSEVGLEKARVAKKAWANRNKHKKFATTAVNNAIRDGRLVKSDSCQNCGKTGCKIEGHHEDYSKPLDVVWLCTQCHSKLHKEKRDVERVVKTYPSDHHTEFSRPL